MILPQIGANGCVTSPPAVDAARFMVGPGAGKWWWWEWQQSQAKMARPVLPQAGKELS